MKSQEVIDFGWKNYVQQLRKETYVDIGILSKPGAQKLPPKDGKSSDITLAELAAIQEFGTEIQVTKKMRGFLGANGLPLSKDTKVITIPPRPFMRQTFDEEEKALARLVEEKDREVLNQRTTRRKALSEIGQTHRQQVQRAMSTQGKFAENHPFTKERKKSSTPLIDEGGLRQAIDYEVG